MGTHYSPKISTAGLVLHLDAANTKSYPGSGSTWFDLSGNGKNATLTVPPTFNSSNRGQFVFDGVDDYILLPAQYDAQAPLTGYGAFTGADTSTFTIEMWIKTSQVSGISPVDAPGLIARSDSDIWANFTLYNGYVYWVHYTDSWQGNLKSTTMVSDNRWRQIVYVNEASKIGNLYVDGVRESTGASTLSGANYFSPDNIGRGYSSKHFSGSISVVKFYQRSLTQEEVRLNYEAIRGRYNT